MFRLLTTAIEIAKEEYNKLFEEYQTIAIEEYNKLFEEFEEVAAENRRLWADDMRQWDDLQKVNQRNMELRVENAYMYGWLKKFCENCYQENISIDPQICKECGCKDILAMSEKNSGHESCRECDGDISLVRNRLCLDCEKFNERGSE